MCMWFGHKPQINFVAFLHFGDLVMFCLNSVYIE